MVKHVWGYPAWLKSASLFVGPLLLILAVKIQVSIWNVSLALLAVALGVLVPLEAFRRAVTLGDSYIEATDLLGRRRKIAFSNIEEVNLMFAPRIYISSKSGERIMIPQFLGDHEEIIAEIDLILRDYGVSVL